MSGKWSPAQYLKFEDHRTRPARDLLAAVPGREVRSVVDLGCCPGNSTELLVDRFPDARVVGMDSSPEMIESARKRLPRVDFEVSDIRGWRKADRFGIVFANAVLQWLPDHATLLPALAERLESGGTLAIQMPDNLDEPSHLAMRRSASTGPWRAKLADASGERTEIMPPTRYYEILRPHFARLEIWKTTYHHPLDGVEGIIEWFKSTGLKPYLSRLDESERDAYLDVYRSMIAEHYPVQGDGKVLLAFPRLFIVATRS